MPTGKYMHGSAFEDIVWNTQLHLSTNVYYFNCQDVQNVFVSYSAGAFNIHATYYAEDGTSSTVIWSGGASGATIPIDQTKSVCRAYYDGGYGVFITFLK